MFHACDIKRTNLSPNSYTYRDFAFVKVYICKNDFNAMCAEVYKHQHIETGGNLFGLWTTTGSAVIRVVLGPGQHCKRTNTSFHQDLEYMERVGRFVNDNYMLCHIGEWRSHHNLSLNKPSAGDESTIRRNFPQGVSKFLVIIANIKNADTIKLSPYFFTDGGTRYELAERVVLDSDSPFSTDADIVAQINEGAEGKEHQQRSDSFLVEVANHGGAPLGNTGNRQNSQRGGNTNPTRMQADQSPSQLSLSTPSSKSPSSSKSLANPSKSKPQTNPSSSNTQVNPSALESHDYEDPLDINDSDLYPPRDYEQSSAGHENVTPASQAGASARNQADPDKNKNGDEETLPEREIVLKKIHDHLKYWFGSQTDSMFKFKKSKKSLDALEIRFKHAKNFWMVRSPKDFPTNPAELFSSRYQVSLDVTKVYRTDIVEPLNNDINILLSVKKRCDSSNCWVCKHFTRESLSQFDFNYQSMAKLVTFAEKLVDDITRRFSDMNNMAIKCLSESQAKITFKHGGRFWIIDVPAYFPDVPAKVHYLAYEGCSQTCDVTLHGRHSGGLLALNTSELIIKAIYLACNCTSCCNARYR